MRRTQIQIEEKTFARLRALSYRRNTPIAQLIREAIDMAYGTTSATVNVDDLGFVGAGKSSQPSNRVVSEEHDTDLDEAYRA